MKWRILKAIWTVVDLLRSPAYAVPLVVNLTGSVWFFLLIGKAGRWGFLLSTLGDDWENDGRFYGRGAVVTCTGEEGTEGEEELPIMQWNWLAVLLCSADGFIRRTKPHGPYYQFSGVPVHGAGRVVGRGEGYIERYSPPKTVFSYARLWYQCHLLNTETDTWIGMAFVLGGIALCVQSKNT